MQFDSMQLNWIWIEFKYIEWIHKLKLIELNMIFFSFGFNMVCVFVEISIKLNLIEFNSIQFNNKGKKKGGKRDPYFLSHIDS